MGDTGEIQGEPKRDTCDAPTPSIDVLKESKPSENIAISDETNVGVAEESSTPDDTTERIVKTEEPKKADEPKADESPKDDKEGVSRSKAPSKNRSDIFSLNKNKNKNMPSIFSVKGAPSKAIHNTSIDSASSDTIGSRSSRKSQIRNPLTGIGVSSNDEYRNKPTKRRDGNPLLGVGYKDDEEFFSPPPTQRIPPGGHSKGLW